MPPTPTDAYASITAPATINLDVTRQLAYSIGVGKVSRTNLIEVEARFDSSKLDYVGSSVADGASAAGFIFLGAPTYDPATGAYKANLAILQADALFSTDDLSIILTVGFEAKAGAAAYNDMLHGTLEYVTLHMLDADGPSAANAWLSPQDAPTSIDSSLRWDVSGGVYGVPDGALDMLDIAFIMENYYACTQGSTRWAEARWFDANGDGVVDLYDLLFIMSYI